jgi:Ca2+-binding EF-hand superfamily protein
LGCAQLLDPNGDGSVQKTDVLPIFAKRLETKETTDQLVQAFRVFDRQNRGKFLVCVLLL